MTVTFTGSTYYSTTSVPGGLNMNSAPFTCSLWIYLTSRGGNLLAADNTTEAFINVVGSTLGGNGGIQFADSIGLTAWSIDGVMYPYQGVNFGANQIYSNCGALSLNTWTHIALTFAPPTVFQAYRNGVAVGSTGTVGSTSGGATTAASAWHRLVIGGFNGDAQDATLWNRALSAAEVQALYRRRAAVLDRTGLVGHWPLFGGGSSQVDLSGSGRTLSATGSVNDAPRSAPSSWGGIPFAVVRSTSAPITVGPKYLRLISGARTEALSVVTSGGAGSAGEIPALNASGILDASFLPRVTTSAGAADAGKVVALNASGVLDASIVNSTVTSSGAASAGKVVALDSSGLIDSSAFAATAPTITATAAAALSAGNLVYIDSATGQVRPADNSLGRKASGFVLSAYSAGSTATVRTTGRLTGLSGLTPGSAYYLAAAGGITDTAPTTAGLTWQYVGVAISAAELNFSPSFSVLL